MSTRHPLYQYAENAGETLSSIAARAKTTRQTLHRLVRGEQNASLNLLRRISEATNGAVTLNDFAVDPPSAHAREGAQQ